MGKEILKSESVYDKMDRSRDDFSEIAELTQEEKRELLNMWKSRKERP